MIKLFFIKNSNKDVLDAYDVQIIICFLAWRRYCSLEHVVHGYISTILDVYSFGILILKIISARKSIDLQKSGEAYLREWVHIRTDTFAYKNVVSFIWVIIMCNNRVFPYFKWTMFINKFDMYDQFLGLETIWSKSVDQTHWFHDETFSLRFWSYYTCHYRGTCMSAI